MNVIRQLTPDEYEQWNGFVNQSPQGSLFQTIEWNQMIYETDPQSKGFLIIASLKENRLQAGIIVCYRGLHERKVADLPSFSYVSPILAPDLNYEDRHHTYYNYSVLADLLKKLADEIKYVRLENPPDIWDIRPYKFQSWDIETTYTYMWKQTDLGEAWKMIDPVLQKAIHLADMKFAFKVDEKWEYIQRFIKLSSGGDVLQKRIDWLRDRDLCRLYVVEDLKGKGIGMTLAILSRENRTAYLWGSMCNDLTLENEIFPYLFWKSYVVLTEKLSCVDLGGSSRFSIGQIKDKLGCQHVYRYTTTCQERNSAK